MSALVHQRCRQHAQREAVARCPSCQHYFCRECVTEHEERVICAACLRQLVAAAGQPRRHWTQVRQGLLALLGGLLCWLIFYYGGRILLAIPSDFHEGTFWQKEFLP